MQDQILFEIIHSVGELEDTIHSKQFQMLQNEFAKEQDSSLLAPS